MQTHNFAATYQLGIVSAVDAVTHRLRVRLPALEDLETAWLPMLTANAGGNAFYCLPDAGELVAVILDARGEDGCVLGAIYNAQDTPKADSGEVWERRFQNGTVIRHDRRSGEVFVHAAGKVRVQGCPVEVVGGTVTVSGGDVVADGVSLKNHVHTGDSGGTTSPPR